jgi:hypothetical protein
MDIELQNLGMGLIWRFYLILITGRQFDAVVNSGSNKVLMA